MKKGTKVVNLPMKTSITFPDELNYVIYGTIRGSIGIYSNLPENVYNLLLDLQTAILSDLPKSFGMDHARWRVSKVTHRKFFLSFLGSCN